MAKSWLETLRSSHEARAVDSSTFSRHHLSIINRVLRRPGVEVRVASPPDDDFTIYGFAVLEGTKAHLVYVRKAWRKMGIASELVKGLPIPDISFSTWSPDVQQWIFEKYRGIRYLPNWIDTGVEHGRAA